MTRQMPNPVARKLQVIEAFDEHPHIKRILTALDDAAAKYTCALEDGENLSGGERIAHVWNCLVEFGREFEAAKSALGLDGNDQPSIERSFLAEYDRREPRTLSLGEERAIRVAVAYQSGLRLKSAGTKDTPMEAALQVAATIEGLPLETGPEEIRKSIQRFRKSIVGQELFKFDRDTFRLKVCRAEDVLLGGRPLRRARPKSVTLRAAKRLI